MFFTRKIKITPKNDVAELMNFKRKWFCGATLLDRKISSNRKETMDER
jgi:hypothetical protein